MDLLAKYEKYGTLLIFVNSQQIFKGVPWKGLPLDKLNSCNKVLLNDIFLEIFLRLDSKIKSKSLNNTYLNIIEILFLFPV